MTKTRLRAFRWRVGMVAAALLMLPQWGAAQAQPQVQPGLLLTYTVDQQSDTVVAPNVWLYVPAGAEPTPFLAPGKFTAVWSGFLSAELRGDFLFRAELRGALKLEVNNVVVLDTSGTGAEPGVASKPVRLNKGANALRATFLAPAAGESRLRLQWSEKGVLWEPIPLAALTRSADPAPLVRAEQWRHGRELFFEHRCAKCHAGGVTNPLVPEAAQDAPSFAGIGSRRHYGWMVSWILDPRAQRASARMPKLLHGPAAGAEAAAMAAYLASLQGEEQGPGWNKAGVEAGQALAEKLHCAGCHNLPGAKEADPKKLSLDQVNFKFPPASLVAFLKNPGAHYGWIRMPRFKLSDEEFQQLASYLSGNAPQAKQAGAPGDPAVVARGQALVQTAGCLNCHGLKLDNQFKTKALAELKPERLAAGCLGATPTGAVSVPAFGFRPEEREALQAFLGTDRAALNRHSPVEFSERQARLLNCQSCHGALEGFPALPLLGGKLRPEWMRQFVAGEVAFKPRPWLAHQIPAFPLRAEGLAAGLAMSHGYAPQTVAEPPGAPDLAKIGQKFVGADGGFSCISCHAVGDQKATQVFESEGINLARSAARLQKDYFIRWLLNPLRVEPTTKMPVYFDEEGKSQLSDILDGSAAKQIEAIWQYVRQGEKIQPPGAP